MKILIWLLISTVILMGNEEKILKIYNYNDYMANRVLIKFAQEHKVKVWYELYENNSVLNEKITQEKEGFDLACPSANFIQSYIQKGMLQKIDKTKLPHFTNLQFSILNQSYDPENLYTVPYFWGTLGIIYDTSKTKPIVSWHDLWRKDLQNSILIGSDYRDVFGFTLKSLGYSANSQHPDEIKQAYEKLLQLIPNIKAIGSNSVPKYFLKDGFSVGVVFNGDAKMVIEQQAIFSYVYPKEGALKWIDSFVLLKNSKEPELAHLFLDAILEASTSAMIAEEVGYATPNKEAYKQLNEKTQKNSIIYPLQTILDKSEILLGVGECNDLYKEYWDRFIKEYENTKKGTK